MFQYFFNLKIFTLLFHYKKIISERKYMIKFIIKIIKLFNKFRTKTDKHIKFTYHHLATSSDTFCDIMWLNVEKCVALNLDHLAPHGDKWRFSRTVITISLKILLGYLFMFSNRLKKKKKID